MREEIFSLKGAHRVIGLKLSGRRTQVMLAAFAALGVLFGAKMARRHPAESLAQVSPENLAGVWELKSLNGVILRPEANLAVLSQHITFRENRIFGETRPRTGSSAATTAMPFPDSSVRRVTSSEDGFETIVTWEGTYRILNRTNLDLTVGKAKYRANTHWNPQTATLELDHDAILTYPGAALYQPARPAAGTQSASLSVTP